MLPIKKLTSSLPEPSKQLGQNRNRELNQVNDEVLNQNINVQLYEILKESGIDYNTIKIMIKHKRGINKDCKHFQQVIQTTKNKDWRVKRKLMVHKDLSKEYTEKLKGYYNNIAGEKQVSGIGADELEDPLITLGIAKNRAEVEEILNSFKTHKFGKLNFEEFINILNGTKMQKKGKNSSTAILEFFRSRKSIY